MSEFPILFTVGQSNKHEVMIINPGQGIKELSDKVKELVASSPNCSEPLSKYAKKSESKVSEIKVRWSGEPREAKLWPTSTILTEDNSEALLSLVALHGGKDILEVTITQTAIEEEKKEE